VQSGTRKNRKKRYKYIVEPIAKKVLPLKSHINKTPPPPREKPLEQGGGPSAEGLRRGVRQTENTRPHKPPRKTWRARNQRRAIEQSYQRGREGYAKPWGNRTGTRRKKQGARLPEMGRTIYEDTNGPNNEEKGPASARVPNGDKRTWFVRVNQE